jgi:hypothetical protein
MREAANVLDPHALGGKADSNRRSLSQTSRRHRSLQLLPRQTLLLRIDR